MNKVAIIIVTLILVTAVGLGGCAKPSPASPQPPKMPQQTLAPTPTPQPSPQLYLWTFARPPEGGTVSPGNSYYSWGTEVTVTATPSPGYRFVSWSGGNIQGTSPTITITMEHDWDVVANFEPISTLTPTPTPSLQVFLWTLVLPPGGGTISPIGGTQGWHKSIYDVGTEVTLTAMPSSGYRFVSWSGEVQNTSPTITLNMKHDWSVEANFEPTSTPTPIVTPGVSVTLDTVRSVYAPVSSEGMVFSVTTEDGTNSRLTVPASALLSEVTITITQILGIQGLPIQGTFVGGIHMAPDGLQFSTPCTLEVDLPADMGAVRLVGVTFSSEGVGKLKPVEVRGSRAVLTIDHFSNAVVLTVDSMVDLVVHCDGGAEGQMIKRDEYFESPRVKSRIRSGFDEDGKEYQRFEFIETTGDPAGSHGKIWTYIDENGVEHSRWLQYNSDGSLSRWSDQIDGQDVDSSVLDSIFTPNFATRGDPPGPGEVATALERLREKICGEEEEVDCTAIASISVSPNYWELEVGGSKQLAASVRDVCGNPVEGRAVAWSSSADSVVSVDASGLVRGVSEGTAIITATVDGKSGSATIEVITPLTPLPSPPEDYSLLGTWGGPLGRCNWGSETRETMITERGSGFVSIVVTESPDPRWYFVFSCNGVWDWYPEWGGHSHLEFQGTGVVGKYAGGGYGLTISGNDYSGTGETIGEGNFTYETAVSHATGTINFIASLDSDGFLTGQVWPNGDPNGYCFYASRSGG